MNGVEFSADTFLIPRNRQLIISQCLTIKNYAVSATPLLQISCKINAPKFSLKFGGQIDLRLIKSEPTNFQNLSFNTRVCFICHCLIRIPRLTFASRGGRRGLKMVTIEILTPHYYSTSIHIIDLSCSVFTAMHTSYRWTLPSETTAYFVTTTITAKCFDCIDKYDDNRPLPL